MRRPVLVVAAIVLVVSVTAALGVLRAVRSLDDPEVQQALLARLRDASGVDVRATGMEVSLASGIRLVGVAVANPKPIPGDLLTAESVGAPLSPAAAPARPAGDRRVVGRQAGADDGARRERDLERREAARRVHAADGSRRARSAAAAARRRARGLVRRDIERARRTLPPPVRRARRGLHERVRVGRDVRDGTGPGIHRPCHDAHPCRRGGGGRPGGDEGARAPVRRPRPDCGAAGWPPT